MARVKSPKRKPSRSVDREVSGALATGPKKGLVRTVSEGLAQAPLFTTSIKLSELGNAFSRIDLTPLSTPLSSFGDRFAHAYQSPFLGKKAAFFSPPSPPMVMTSVETLGVLVRAYREEFALSQQSFAERAGVGRRFISELENGKPSLEFDKVMAVARVAGIDLFAVRRTPSAP